MVQPKTIGETRTGSPKTPQQRRHDLRVAVPLKDEIRKVEAFDAAPALNEVQEIITADNSTFRYLRLARIALEGGHGAERTLAGEEAVYYVNRGKAKIAAG